MTVVDASQSGAVVRPAAGEMTGSVEAGQLLAVHELMAQGAQFSLVGLASSVELMIAPDGTPDPAAAIDAIRQDLDADAASDSPSIRVWADAVTSDGESGASLAAPTAPTDVTLDALQAFLLLRGVGLQSMADLQSNPDTGAVATDDMQQRALAMASPDPDGGCDLADEVAQETLDTAAGAAGKGVGKLHDAWYEHLKDIGKKSALGAALGIFDAIAPALSLFLTSLAFKVMFDPDEPAFERTTKTDEDQGWVDLTATPQFVTPDNSHFTHCLVLLLTAMGHELDLPTNVPLPHIGVTWTLAKGGGDATHAAFANLCYVCVSKNNTYYTDDKGHTDIVVNGTRQKTQKSKANPVHRNAIVRVEFNPNDVQDAMANFIKTMWDAVSTALDLPEPGIGLTLGIVNRVLYSMGILGAAKTVDVTDWSDDFDAHYDLQVSPAPNEGAAVTGTWELTGLVHLTYNKDSDLYQGAAPIKYFQAAYTSSAQGPALDLGDITAPPFDHSTCPQLGGCPIPGCTMISSLQLTGTTPGTISLSMSPIRDNKGIIVGFKDLNYLVSDASETYNSTNQLSGNCTFTDTGGQMDAPFTITQSYALSGWSDALSGAQPDVTRNPDNPFLPGWFRSSLPGAGNNADAIVILTQPFPGNASHGAVRESLQIYPSDL